ncbi:MAG: hypothetical protein V1779_15840 [bacterium]
MKKMVIVIWLLISTNVAFGQNIEDALRFSSSNAIISARAGGLGTSYLGIADDYSSLAFNPAGIALIDKGEISVGFGFMANKTETSFIGTVNPLNTNDAYMSNFGIVAPFKTDAGNAAIAIGHYMESNFDNSMDFEAFNPYSSYIKSIADNAYENGLAWDENLASYLWLSDDYNYTPVKDRVYQQAMISENGGLHNLTGGIAFELTQFLSAGFSLTGKWGTYEYLRDYKESDVNNIYQNFDYDYDSVNNKYSFYDLDFSEFRVDEYIKQDISGVTGAFGIQGKVENFMRFGFTIQFPTAYDISERFSQKGVSYFDNGDKKDTNYNYENYYSFTSPWIFSGGLSFHFEGLTITSGVEFSDLKQMEFTDANFDLKEINLDIKRLMSNRLKWGIGLEYEIPFLPVSVRGSYNSTTAPYENDIDGAEIISAAFGMGIYLAPNVRLDALGRWSQYSNMWNIYSGNWETELVFKRSVLDFGLQLTYRY